MLGRLQRSLNIGSRLHCLSGTQRCRDLCQELPKGQVSGVVFIKCPANVSLLHRYVLEHHQRCYSKIECVKKHGYVVYGPQCVAFCPSGYRANNESVCVACAPEEPCISFCTPESPASAFTIYNLADAEKVRGCQIFNASLVITIRQKVNESQLIRTFTSIREIRGHLKVYRWVSAKVKLC